MLSRAVNANGVVVSGERTRLACTVWRLAKRLFCSARESSINWIGDIVEQSCLGSFPRVAGNGRRVACARQLVSKIPPSVRRVDPRDGFRSSRRDECSTFVACVWAKIDHPIGALNHLEVVLDHDDGVASLNQSLKQPHEDRDVVEMQTSCRLVEDEKVAARRAVLFRTNIFIGEVSDELKPLRFAAGKRVERLAEPQISEPDFIQNIERIAELFRFADQREKLDRFVNSQLEHVVNRLLVQLHAQDVRLKTAAFAFGAANVKIAQELHLDLFKPGAAAAFAAAAAGVERERA